MLDTLIDTWPILFAVREAFLTGFLAGALYTIVHLVREGR